MTSSYSDKLKAFLRQSQYVDTAGHHYKEMNGHTWVLKFHYYCGPTGNWDTQVYWSKVEGWNIPTI